MTVEVLYFEGCPHAAAALALVRRCLARLGLGVTLIEREGDYPSPTVRINGRDVMGAPATGERACRLDVPTEDHVLNALRGAMKGAGR